MDELDHLSYPPYEVIFALSSARLRLELYSHSKKIFQIHLLNTEINSLTNNLCSSLREFCTLLKNAIIYQNDKVKLKINETGLLVYECEIEYPLFRSISFSFQMEEIPFSELKHIEYLILKANKKISVLEKNLENIPNQSLHNDCSFSIKKNSGYFQFFNKMKSISRNKHEDGRPKTIWISESLSLTDGKAYFSLQITNKNKKFDVCHAYIGVGFSPCFGNEFNENGCYVLANGKIFFNSNFHVSNDFFFVGDIVSVFVNVEKGCITWERDGEKIADIPFKEEYKKEKIHPIIALTNVDESATFI
jgi:hypothetical protein